MATQGINRRGAVASASSGDDIVPITPDDDNDLPGGICRGIVYDGTGTIALIMASGETRDLTDGFLTPNVIHPLRVKRVLSTGTTVTDIRAIY